MIQEFIPGSVWQLSINANCIPAGTYRFEEIQDEFLIFSVGSKISFGLTKYFYAPFLTPGAEPDSRTTSTNEFLETYARLFHRHSVVQRSTQGMTYCVMDSRLQRRFRKLIRLHKTQEICAPIH